MNIALPFYDDSTLIFASKMGEKLKARGHCPHYIQHEHINISKDLSERQIIAHLKGQKYSKITIEDLFDYVEIYDAIITSKGPDNVNKHLQKLKRNNLNYTPCYIAFQAGLDFTPRRGYRNRSFFDAVFLMNSDHLAFANPPRIVAGIQHISYGHPYFDAEKLTNGTLGEGDILFSTQSICPPTLQGRTFMVDLLAAIARRNPDRRVVIKLRHLPDENQLHQHKEQYSYPEIVDRHLDNHPENLVFSTDPMEEALQSAAYCITCTSTAAMDAITHGVPCGVYTNYVENYFDIYAPKMESEFEGSGLIMTTEEILNLTVRQPSPYWVKKFYNPNLLTELETVIDTFHQRKDQ